MTCRSCSRSQAWESALVGSASCARASLLIWAALGRRPGVAPLPVRPQAVDRDQPEPGPEGAWPLIVVEPGQLADQRGQDFLDHILRVGSLRDVGTDPFLDERRVKLRQTSQAA